MLYFLIAIGATTVGSLTGMGGGVIIKPLMDVLHGFDVQTIGVLSSLTVFSMSVVSIGKQMLARTKIPFGTAIPLALGSVMGGLAGEKLLQVIVDALPELLHGPALAVGAAEEEGIPRLLLKDHVGDLTHGADGELQPPVALGGHGDGGLADHGDGELHELAVGGLRVGGHAEGPLMAALFLHAQDFTGLRLNRAFSLERTAKQNLFPRSNIWYR